jgi:transposase
MAIWHDARRRSRLTARYASVRNFVVTLRGTSSPEARLVITNAPGEEGQVDYGEGPMVRYPDTGQYRRTRLFVLPLGYSRKAARMLVCQSSTQIWAELHERAFRRVGGTVRVVVLDNLKEGVLTPDIYDAALNPLYRDYRSRGESGSRRRACAEDAAPRALRVARPGASVSRSLGIPLGRHAASTAHEAPRRRDVC